MKDQRKQRNDVILSVAMMFIISGTIMAAAAGTLYAGGLGLSKASQMIELLEPLAGRLATSIFAVGIISAGVSSQLPNVLMLPWLLCDYNKSERHMALPRYRIMVLLISLLGLVVPIFDAPPVFVMILSQAFNSVILPITVACILYLGNRKDIMGNHKNGLLTNIVLVAILIFSFVNTSMGIKGVWQLIIS
jgi:Mn2+/Fe2+ NRAMP family transporter